VFLVEQEVIVDGLVTVALLGVVAYSVLISLGVTGYITYKPKRGERRAGNFEIVIVSKADHRVKNSLLESLRYHTRRFGRVTLVIDEGAPLVGLLRGIRGVRLIIVPSSYRRDLIGKGRALQYFVDCCVERDKWYVFIDDDNLILDDTFLYEIPVYEAEGRVAANGVIIPRPGRSTVAYVMDWIRFMDDILIYRFFTGLIGKPLLGLHGDLLIVKGSVLKEIGFNMRTLTEDFEFASCLVRRGYKTWQSATRVSIRSPNSIKDLVLQRGRWFKGIFYGIKRAPIGMKMLIILRSFTFSVGLFILLLFIPFVYYVGYLWFIVPSGLYYVSTYSYGVYKSGKPILLLLLPFFGVIEASSRIYGFIMVNGYVVIDKN
jgi:cellulose synthase/poly-beta-1,6-N-acetylglucosamine synthase-like glycosyltransferase